MLKTFKELRSIDLSQHTQLKPTFYKDANGKSVPTARDKWLEYIEWAVVLDLLYQNGAEAVFFNAELHPSFPNTLIINLRIDGIATCINYPIINGNSIISNPNQMDIHKAELRGFVKAVAVFTGLGLSLWMKEERITSEYLTESHTVQINVKKLLESASTTDELNNIWKSMSEEQQVKYKDVFSNSKKRIAG